MLRAGPLTADHGYLESGSPGLDRVDPSGPESNVGKKTPPLPVNSLTPVAALCFEEQPPPTLHTTTLAGGMFPKYLRRLSRAVQPRVSQSCCII